MNGPEEKDFDSLKKNHLSAYYFAYCINPIKRNLDLMGGVVAAGAAPFV